MALVGLHVLDTISLFHCEISGVHVSDYRKYRRRKGRKEGRNHQICLPVQNAARIYSNLPSFGELSIGTYRKIVSNYRTRAQQRTTTASCCVTI